MRSHSEYIPLTQDQIALAQHTDIVEYLRERGEKVQKEGNHYIWEKHDSCVIHGYKWYQNSTGKHGAAVAFVQNFSRIHAASHTRLSILSLMSI